MYPRAKRATNNPKEEKRIMIVFNAKPNISVVVIVNAVFNVSSVGGTIGWPRKYGHDFIITVLSRLVQMEIFHTLILAPIEKRF